MSRHRNFTFTFNNWDTKDPQETWINSIECRYMSYGKEIAPSTGTPHLQGFICFTSAKTKSAVIKLMPGCHIEVMMGSLDQNVHYCNKDGDYTERGDKPLTNDNKGRAEKLRWKRALDLAKEGKINEIDADIQFRYYSNIKRIKADHEQKPDPQSETAGIWIYGEAGCGKTRSVWEKYPDLYIKSRNKWWGGYDGQDIVLCDDLGKKDAEWMGSFLKDWGGQYPFQAETKGGGMQIRPKIFIVTSQYSIEQLWNDKETQDALFRRYKIFKNYLP
jgi:hypothetical protein